MAESDHIRLKRMRFRAWHRGFKEMDLILGRFADTHLDRLSGEELDAMEALLSVPDQQLYGWYTGREAVPADFDTPLWQRIKSFEPSDPQ